MAKNGTSYTRKGGIYHPLTNTQQVMNPDGSRLEQRLQNEEQAIRGKGTNANAREYPFRYLGMFNSISALNTALNQIFHTTDEKWQGSLRAILNGQMVFIQQIGIYIARGDWAQVVIGLVAPSSDGTLLVTSGTPNIIWRSRDTGNNSVVSNDWQTIASVDLKTVNGESLIGSGDIVISQEGRITIDSELDPSSVNPVQNKKVYAAIQELQAHIDSIPESSGGGVIVCKQWADVFLAGNEGDYAYKISNKVIYKYTSGEWVGQGAPQASVLYVNAQAQSVYFWNGTDMVPMLGEAPLSAINVNSSAPVNSKAVADYVENEKKVIKVTYWGEMPQDANLGEYAYDTDGKKVYLFSDMVDPQGDWVSLGWPKEDVLYLREEHSTYYHYDGDEMIALLDEDKVVSSIPATGGTASVPTAAAVRKYVGAHSGGGSGGEQHTEGYGEPDFNDPLRPEYYLTAEQKANVKWGLPLYEWPLRCYNGVVNIAEANLSASTDAVVFAPAERIVYKMGVTIPYTTYDVCFNTATKSFVINVSNTYYKAWGNSDEWNDPVTGKARTDCVFSDISTDTSYSLYDERKYLIYPSTDITSSAGWSRGTQSWDANQVPYSNVDQAKRNSYIFDGSSFVDITTLMTDFTSAVQAAVSANNGSLRLSRRIYFVGSVTNGSSLLSISNKSSFEIDGQGGVLFVRNTSQGQPQRGVSSASGFRTEAQLLAKAAEVQPSATADNPKEVSPFVEAKPTGTYGTATVFSISLSSGTIKNITIAALRDRDNGAPGGHWRMSSSDSKIKGIDFGADTNAANHDITIKNIEFVGMYEDFVSHSGTNSANTNFVIDGWKSRDLMQTVPNGIGWTIKNADVKQAEYVGAGLHIFYGQGKGSGLWVENSRFQAGKYSSAMLSFHELNTGVKNGVAYSYGRDMHFTNCELLGCLVFNGATARGWIHFQKCDFKQIHDGNLNNDNVLDHPAAINMIFSNMWFKDCHFDLNSYVIANANYNEGKPRIAAVFENCGIIVRNVESVAPSDFGGVIYHKNVELPYKSDLLTPISWGISDSKVGTILFLSGVRDNSGELITKLPDLIEKQVDESVGNIQDEITTCQDSISQVNEELHGSGGSATYTVSNLEDRPVSATEGQTCFVTSTDKIYTCQKAAVKSSVMLYMQILQRPESSVTQTFSITLTEGETIELSFTYDADTAYMTLFNTFLASIRALGYTAQITSNANDSAGERAYIRIYAQGYGNGGASSIIINNVQGLKVTYNVNGSNNKTKPTAYEPPTWDVGIDAESGGIIAQIESLEAKVKSDAPIGGTTAHRPNLDDVPIGYCYFDLQIGKAIFSTGTAWKCADGSDPDNT